MTLSHLDWLCSVALVTLGALLAVAVGVRVVLRGKVEFERVHRHGFGGVFAAPMMHGAYWTIQPLARFLVRLGVAPNTLTALSALFGLVAGVLLALGSFGLAAVCLIGAGALDALDGLVARLGSQVSASGALLDSCMDRYSEFFVLAGAAFLYRGNGVLLICCLAAIHGSFMVSYAAARAEGMAIRPPRTLMRRPERLVLLASGALLSPFSVTWLEVELGDLSIRGFPMAVAVILMATLANLSAAERIGAVADVARNRERGRA